MAIGGINESIKKKTTFGGAPRMGGRAVLITGAYRSGTTWVGEMLAQAPGVFYLHEPFNPVVRVPGLPKIPVNHWFEYLHEGNEAHFRRPVNALVAGRFSVWNDLVNGDIRSMRAIGRSIANSRRRKVELSAGARPLLKDPIAILAAEWLAERYGMDVVVTIRHPAAFVSSIKRLRWPIDHAKEFLSQKHLMDRFLSPYVDEIRASRVTDDFVDQAALTWKLLYHVVDQYRSTHPDWHFVYHEDLSLAPEKGFRALFRSLDLAYTDRVAAVVKEHSSSSNPNELEVTAGKVAMTRTTRVNSRANVISWQRRLAEQEIARIRGIVDPVCARFYNESSWDSTHACGAGTRHGG